MSIDSIHQKIANKLGLSLDQLVFNYRQANNITILDLITFNAAHKQSFLFHSVKAIDQSEAAQKMLLYIEEQRQYDVSYTIQWQKIGENVLHTSYFRAQDMYGALDKFYYDRDRNAYKIYSLTLNPIS